MNSAQMTALLRHIRTIAGDRSAGSPLDGELLERFRARRDEEAFAGLVRRHGPMVWNVCRHVLHHWHDAEDAFQATFLVLARKAQSIHRPQALASWLYGVAYHLALKAQARAVRQKTVENRGHDMAAGDPLLDVTLRELRTTLYEELARLPEKNRTPLVLCYLEGKTQGEAARLLGWTKETVRGRLDQGRAHLRRRLSRRGLAMTSALLASILDHQHILAVPASLLKTTVQSAALMAAGKAAGAISTKVATLASAGLKDLFLTKLKVVAMAVLLGACAAGGTAVGYQALAGDPSQAAQDVIPHRPSRQAVSSQKTALANAGKEGEGARGEKVTIRGRVLDPKGNKLPGADVAVLALTHQPLRTARQGPWGAPIVEKTKTDGEGRFSLQVPPTAREHWWKIFVVAGAAGYALDCQSLDADTRQAEIDLRLPPEAALRGRLVDLQGQAAAGVQVQVTGIGLSGERDTAPSLGYVAGALRAHPTDIGCWPKASTTNAQGEFVIHGLAPAWSVTIRAQHDKYAPQELDISGKDREKGEEITRALLPARTLEGTVFSADTGKPVPNAALKIRVDETQTIPRLSNSIHYAECRADGDGRYRLSLPPGDFISIVAQPPAGAPYTGSRKELRWPKSGAVRQETNLSLRRGIPVLGTVHEVPSGKPVAGAHVEFEPFRDNNPFYRQDVIVHTCRSGPDGKFELIVPPGTGHLLINGPTLDYLHTEITTKNLYGFDVNPNRRNYPDGLVALNLKPQAGPQHLTATLKRGVTLAGSVIAPDGKPVQKAVLICRSYIPYGYDLNATHTKEVRNGRFELPGCDPDGIAEIFFLDVKNRLGAVARLSGKEAGKPVTVRLQPCGSARARFVDEQGKPVPKFDNWLEIRLCPGAHIMDALDAEKVNLPLADRAFDPAHTRTPTDAQGRSTFPCLIPEAPYSVGGQIMGLLNLHTEFTVRPGQALDLGDIRVKTRRAVGEPE